MSDLVSITTELLEVERFMNSARFQLEEKKEELRRLEEALNKLGNSKTEFFQHYELCVEPEFTKNTLHGDNAEDLDFFKNQELLPSYVGIYYGQINNATTQIDDRIEIVQDNIADLNSSLSSLETQHEGLKKDKKEVENSNE